MWKRIFLVLALLPSAAASGATWFDGLSPAKQAGILHEFDMENVPLGKDVDIDPLEMWDSGTGDWWSQTDIKHSGTRAIKNSIASGAGNRMAFRQSLPDVAFYSAWVLVPQWFDSDWYMLMQTKTETAYCCSNPNFSVNIDPIGNNRLGLHLHSFFNTNGGFSSNGRYVDESPIDLPINQWVHIEMEYKWSKSLTGGYVKVWQDGVEILSVANTRTMTDANYGGNIQRQWAVNAYGEGWSGRQILYVDDMAISSVRLSAADPPPVLAGDFNLDGTVDARDYTVWRDTGRPVSDYDLWKANFGQSLPGVASSAAVPEPSAAILLILTLTILPHCRYLRHYANDPIRRRAADNGAGRPAALLRQVCS